MRVVVRSDERVVRKGKRLGDVLHGRNEQDAPQLQQKTCDLLDPTLAVEAVEARASRCS